ncbi:MAG: GNAT family N-acetyltransferase [Dehalococcoidia bacterium]
MKLDDTALADVIETSLVRLPTLPGQLDYIQAPGVEGMISDTSSGLINMVGAARLTTGNANTVISTVKELYRSRRQSFDWWVGPNSTPRDIGGRLIDAGFRLTEPASAGLAITDLSVPINVNPAVLVRRATVDDSADVNSVLAQGFGTSPHVWAVATAATLRAPGEFKSAVYVAYIDGIDIAVGAAHLVHVPGRPIALLAAAATLPAHRGKGVYTAMVARRLADARANGADAAVIQADPNTSAPVCLKLGFRHLCTQQIYEWTPEGS